jgi:hypothetical protein
MMPIAFPETIIVEGHVIIDNDKVVNEMDNNKVVNEMDDDKVVNEMDNDNKNEANLDGHIRSACHLPMELVT